MTPLTDEQRESVIDIATKLAQGSADAALRRYWYELMCAEIVNRSPEQVAKMEHDKGLAA